MQHSIIKKLVAAGSAALLCVSLAACGNSSAQSASSASSEPAAEVSAEAAAQETKEEAAKKPETTEAPAATEEPKAEITDEPKAETPELIVFAAASMTETLTEIADLFKAVEPEAVITYNFDSSGTLVTQIEEGADCDLFISAAQKQMNEIDGTKDADVNPEGYDLINSDSRVDILENKVTLVVPEGNPAGIESFDDLAQRLAEGDILMAMGNEDVPVGQYTQKILTYYGLDEAQLANAGCITYGSNVKEVTTQVSEASVDCGIIYCTDAYSAGLDIIDVATPEMCGQVIYPAAVLKASANPELAQSFLDFIQTDECMAVFEKVGFAPVEKPADYSADSGEVIVFAAASMTETLEAIAELYKEIAPEVTLTCNFDSSGTLVTQIEEGADCDLFISAAQKQMNEIDGTKGTDVNPEGYDLIDTDSRVDILENKVVLVVPEDNPKGLTSFDDLAAALNEGSILMAMGNEDVPVGQYTQKILDYYGLDEAALATAGCITYGSNVKEVTTQVAEGSVDCGIIYCTDAYSAGLTIVDEATPEMCGQVIYPAAVIKASPNADAAQHFLDYLQTNEAMAVFEGVGFSAVS